MLLGSCPPRTERWVHVYCACACSLSAMLHAKTSSRYRVVIFWILCGNLILYVYTLYYCTVHTHVHVHTHTHTHTHTHPGGTATLQGQEGENGPIPGGHHLEVCGGGHHLYM